SREVTLVNGVLTPANPAGDLTLVAANPSRFVTTSTTPQITLDKGAQLKADFGTTKGNISLRVEARQLSINVPLLTNLGIDNQTSTITVGENVQISGKDVSLTSSAGDQNPVDSITEKLSGHPEVAGLIKSVLGFASDFLGLPISLQVKSPGAGVSL